MIKTEVDYLILVNKKNKIPSNWDKKVELVEVVNCFNRTIKVEKETYRNYLALKNYLKRNNIEIVIESSYRSIEEQKQTLEQYKEYAAIPGYSEHHTGLAIDICVYVDNRLIYENDDMIKLKDLFNQIHLSLADYGFILRYPKGKENITGYNYEPWHFRYVGECAKEIMDNSLTLEEYLNKVEI